MNRQIAGWITHRTVKWVVLAVMLVVAVSMSVAFGSKLSSAQSNDVSAWLPADAESTKVIEQSEAFATEDELTAIVVYVDEDGITGDDLQAVAADLLRFPQIDEVSWALPPALAGMSQAELADLQSRLDSLTDEEIARFTSEDGQAVQVFVGIHIDPVTGWEELPDVLDELRDVAGDGSGDLTAHIGGPAAFEADNSAAFAGVDGILLLAALIVVVVMLLLTYRSPVLWLIPLVCGLLSVGTAQGVVYLLAEHADLTVNGMSAAILSVLVLGAGIDYALLLVARYREELRNFEDRHEAMSHALHRAAPAILASGATVVIGLLCLSFAQLGSTEGLGPVAAVGIVASLLLMLVLLPVLLVVFGRWVFWPFIPRHGDPQPADSGVWGRVGGSIARRPRVVWIATTVALAAACLGLVQLNAVGLSQSETFTTEQKSTVADRVIAEHFPAGEGTPVQVVAKSGHAEEVAAALEQVEGLEPAEDDPSNAATGPGLVADGLVYFERTLTAAGDSADGYATIERARDAVHEVEGAEALVGGVTAVNLDVNDAATADNRLIIPMILVVVLLILTALLRSLVAPLILLGTVVLSFGAALGVSTLVFRHVFGFEAEDSAFPLYAFVFLVALGIDYNIFLMTRVREEASVRGTRTGALVGLAATGGVITSAGLVLAGTFSTLATLPIVFVAQIGFTVALGVLLDTFVVRSVLVTALSLDLGRAMWWPSKLWREEEQASAD
ncbi:MAG: MMPL family transporter [Aeromicrobium sp.]|uniref:MMPL family transporter n=1 Tax=Aeromicrobium sp. TaxID=1871063 RepID=UPI0039E60107